VAIDGMVKTERNLIKELKNRDRDTQKQWEESRISEARYNKKYKEIKKAGIVPKYLRLESKKETQKGKGTRALMKLRCGNMEEENKYWLEEKWKLCVFCGKGKDNINHFVKECEVIKDWFVELKENVEERIMRM